MSEIRIQDLPQIIAGEIADKLDGIYLEALGKLTDYRLEVERAPGVDTRIAHVAVYQDDEQVAWFAVYVVTPNRMDLSGDKS